MRNRRPQHIDSNNTGVITAVRLLYTGDSYCGTYSYPTVCDLWQTLKINQCILAVSQHR